MPKSNSDLVNLRAEIMRAAKHIRRHPADESEKAHLQRLRAAYAEKKIENYVTKVVDAAPPLTPEMRDRLAQILRAGGPAQDGQA
jgi:hypothetical protein